MKETPKTTQQVSCLLKKKTEEKLQEKKCKITLESLFFSSSEKSTQNGGGKLRNKREISLQTNKQHKRGQTKERREQNARKSWPPLSPPLRFWCFPFRRRQSRSVEEGGGAKEAPIIIR